MQSIFHDILQLLEQNQNFVLATVFNRAGSAPRAMGARMAALPDGSIRGTIGGGLLEAQTLQSVPPIFQSRQTMLKEFQMTGHSFSQATPEMICGGRAEVLLELVEPGNAAQHQLYQELLTVIEQRQTAWLVTEIPASAETAVRRWLVKPDGRVVGAADTEAQVLQELTSAVKGYLPELLTRGEGRFLVERISAQGAVYIFGAGHIGQKLAPLCALVGFRTVVVDDRPAYVRRELFEAADQLVALESFERAVAGLELDQDSYAVIVTRGHVHDKTVLAQLLRTPAGYIGMIGSRRKRETIYQVLLTEGFTPADIARVYSPIGLDIGGETPEEIAISIAAEMIKVRAARRQASAS